MAKFSISISNINLHFSIPPSPPEEERIPGTARAIDPAIERDLPDQVERTSEHTNDNIDKAMDECRMMMDKEGDCLDSVGDAMDNISRSMDGADRALARTSNAMEGSMVMANASMHEMDMKADRVRQADVAITTPNPSEPILHSLPSDYTTSGDKPFAIEPQINIRGPVALNVDMSDKVGEFLKEAEESLKEVGEFLRGFIIFILGSPFAFPAILAVAALGVCLFALIQQGNGERTVTLSIETISGERTVTLSFGTIRIRV